MPKKLIATKINMTRRQDFITALPCFSMLSAEQSAELAALMEVVRYLPNELIVEEDALIDCVYILVEGSAEVSHLVSEKSAKKIKAPLAILHSGESIGLNTTGFFSTTGKRTATVTALTDVILLSLDIKKLHDFLEKHSDLPSKLYATTEQILRIRLIKQSLPFSRLTQERLMWLANQIEEVFVPANTVLFKEGEPGDRCYLIRSGQIQITTTNGEGIAHQLAVLKTPTLFGEATLITHAPRNATAIAIEDCQLFELKHQYLSELLESENNVANTFMTLMVDRSRPLQNPRVTAHQRVTADEQPVVILKNPDNGNYFKLSEEGWFIWHLMDGQHTMQEITMKLADEYNIFAPDVVAALISKLATFKFITQVNIDNETIARKQSLFIRCILKIRRILETRIAFGDADKWLTALYQKAAFVLFTPASKVFLTLTIIIGFVAFAFITSHMIELFRQIKDSWFLVVCLIPFTLISVVLHELGHALATKSYGREVHYMGIGWYWLTPIAFTDTSDMWLSSRKSARIFVNLAGVYTDMFVSSISVLLIYIIPNLYIQAFFWLFALFTYINAFRMLNPLQELDGYYVLVDLFDRPRLRQLAVLWLINDFPNAIRHPALFRKNIPEVGYWIACIIFIILVCIVVLLVQTFIFKIFGFKPNNHFISLAIPILVSLASCFGILADIRSQKD